jgi:ribonuclease-3
MENELISPPGLDRNEISQLVGTKINNLDLYQKAFTHKSALKTYTLTDSFETLEFIGDSVLGFVITKFLFDRYEDKQEGFLTKARTKLVRGETLAELARNLQFDRWILMDEKGMRNGWNRNTKVLEDAFEAFIGAIYLDLGLIHAKRFILDAFENIDMNCLMVDDNFKDQLMRYCQANRFDLPTYVINSHTNGIFDISVEVNGQSGTGVAKSKRQAEQNAAEMVIKALSL